MFGSGTRQEIKRLRRVLHRPRTEKSSRRVDHSIMPMLEMGGQRSAQARHVNHFAIFYAFEANKSTCSISVCNDRQKSRATIILFRGRVLCCAYGRRGMPYHTYGADALFYTLADLANPLTSITAQPLTEALALAASSVFLGQRRVHNPGLELGNFVASMQKRINRRKQPGCIVLKDNERQTQCIVYLNNGEVVGLYSSLRGWIQKKAQEQYLIRYVARAKELRAEAFLFQLSSYESLYDMTVGFSAAPSSRTDKVSWLTDPVCQNSLAPMELHTQEPTLADTFNFDPIQDHERDLTTVAAYALRDKARLGYYVNPSKQTSFVGGSRALTASR